MPNRFPEIRLALVSLKFVPPHRIPRDSDQEHACLLGWQEDPAAESESQETQGRFDPSKLGPDIVCRRHRCLTESWPEI